MDTNDDIVFVEEEQPASRAPASEAHKAWKVLVVDDDKAVHDVTRLALFDVTFDGRGLQLLYAYSAKEAREQLAAHPDVGLILLDVVMETDDAGLQFVRYVRDELANHYVRIVLRTGQPGQAPERRVVVEYDINDYKTKDELTAQKLFTTVQSALRSYRDIRVITKNKEGLERILAAAPAIFRCRTFDRFASAVLEQMTTLVCSDDDGVYCIADSVAARTDSDRLSVLAATGAFRGLVGKDARTSLPPEIVREMDEALGEKRNHFGKARMTVVCDGQESAAVLHLAGVRALTEVDRRLVDVFTSKVGIAFHNLLLMQDIEETQREIVFMLSEAVETRSRETGNHVRRMARYCRLLGEMSGMEAEQLDVLERAAPLHDIGKIGIPDSILNKPGRHTPEESAQMREHARIGYEMLKNAKRPILRAGATIAGEHHERWDGTGYPNRKRGAEIHLFGRIAALADVFDALTTARCYKAAWPMEEAIAFVKSERAKHFDPDLVDLLIGALPRFDAVREELRDA